jgi:hypothetical protein
MKQINVYTINELKESVKTKVINRERGGIVDLSYSDNVHEFITELLKEKGLSELEWFIDSYENFRWKANRDDIINHYDLSVIEETQETIRRVIIAEYEYLCSDEHILDFMKCNNWHFTEEGIVV